MLRLADRAAAAGGRGRKAASRRRKLASHRGRTSVETRPGRSTGLPGNWPGADRGPKPSSSLKDLAGYGPWRRRNAFRSSGRQRPAHEKALLCGPVSSDGESRTRTGDTTIFSCAGALPGGLGLATEMPASEQFRSIRTGSPFGPFRGGMFTQKLTHAGRPEVRPTRLRHGRREDETGEELNASLAVDPTIRPARGLCTPGASCTIPKAPGCGVRIGARPHARVTRHV
jgi:hypothetical protein